ncbi:DUF420 domain-containing protein [bacterium]|nr:DUF420 domain-containing protein [bacterium]
MSVTDLPTLNAILNLVSTIFLVSGFVSIKNGKRETHKKFMVSALLSSTFFLTSYLIYHYKVGSVPYPYHDWTRPIYFVILIPHVVFAAVVVPFIVLAVWFAWNEKFAKHVKLVRFVFPVWVYVSITGIVIYAMLYR